MNLNPGSFQLSAETGGQQMRQGSREGPADDDFPCDELHSPDSQEFW